MFSVRQKQLISEAVERLLLSFDHPEMPKERPSFQLQVWGKESWSWADIRPNWQFSRENPPEVNPHNEAMDPENTTIHE